MKRKKPELPRNYRIITEGFRKNKLLALTLLFLIISLLIVVFDFLVNYSILQGRLEEKRKLNEDRKYWENAIEIYPDYRDAYLSLALIEYRLGNFPKANDYLAKVFKIDPNSKEGIMLKEKLEGS